MKYSNYCYTNWKDAARFDHSDVIGIAVHNAKGPAPIFGEPKVYRLLQGQIALKDGSPPPTKNFTLQVWFKVEEKPKTRIFYGVEVLDHQGQGIYTVRCQMCGPEMEVG